MQPLLQRDPSWLFHESNRRNRWLLPLQSAALSVSARMRAFFRAVIERTEHPDFIDTTNGVERVEITCVVGRKLGRLEVTATQVRVTKCLGTLPREKMKTQPSAVGRGDALRFSEKSDEQEKNQISVDLRLKLKVARKFFRLDFAPPPLNWSAACNA